MTDVLDFHIVHNDELIEVRQNSVHLAAIDVENKRVAEVIRVEVRLNAALRVQQEDVHAMAESEIADIIGGHTIQPAHSISAGYGNLCAAAEVVNTALGLQRQELGASIS
jgi:hypothetical protein